MSNSYRLKSGREYAAARANRLIEQKGRCALCSQPIAASEAAYDHDHKTGHCRAVLHRGCNAMLGHIENNMPRHRLTNLRRLVAFLRAIPEYISRDWTDQPLHPTFRTEEEKRLRRNAKARKARAAKKESP